VGLKTISGMMKKLVEEAGIVENITNKIGRRTSISRMALARVPREVMCDITGMFAIFC
jgi:hypothetical protein